MMDYYTVVVNFKQSSYEVMENRSEVNVIVQLSRSSSKPFDVTINLMDITAECKYTHKEIFGNNNLVSYKVATRLKIPWISNVFYLVATLLNGCKHLVTTLK